MIFEEFQAFARFIAFWSKPDYQRVFLKPLREVSVPALTFPAAVLICVGFFSDGSMQRIKEMVCMKLEGGYTPFTKDEWGRQVAG